MIDLGKSLNCLSSGVEQPGQLGWLITNRSLVQIQPPLPNNLKEGYLKELIDLRASVHNVVRKFINTYYGVDQVSWSNVAPVAGDICGAWCINDEFWNLSDMVLALDKKVSEKVLWEWYNQLLDDALKDNEV